MSDSMMPTRARLEWLCRRGCLELDLLLRRYLDTVHETTSLAEQRQFLALLEEEDSILWRWLIDGQPVSSPSFSRIVDKIRSLSDTTSQTLP